MPMPTAGAWPPPAHVPAYNAYREWDAWYVGDPSALHRVYRNRDSSGASASLPPSQRVRPGQVAGGLVGIVSRWIWGAPPPARSTDNRLHVPLAADLSATAAGLLFSEPPRLLVEGEGNKATQARLDKLVEDGINTVFRHAAEACSTFGDVYLRPVIDREVSPDAAIVSIVHADGALPVLRWGHLVEVTFWSEIAVDGQAVYRLLEHHDVKDKRGRITYALFVGTTELLGRQVPFADQGDQLGWLLDLVKAGTVSAEGVQLTDLDRLDVVRIPNAGPQRKWRNTPGLKYLGRSDFDGNEPIFDRVDAAWTSWMRDLHLGRGRISVPAYMMENLGAGQGAYWDADREVYSALNAMPDKTGAGGSTITASQFAIRHVEHKATVDALVETAMRHSGLSAQTLGEEGDVAMTATEAQSRERMSYITRGDRVAGYAPRLADYLKLHLQVEAKAGMGKVEPVRPKVEFADGAAAGPESVAKTVQLLRAAEAISTETAVKMVHPEWDKPQVDAEVKRIQDDQAASMPAGAEDPFRTLEGHAGTGPKPPPDGKPGEGDNQQE